MFDDDMEEEIDVFDLEVRQLCYEVSALSFYVVGLGNHLVGLLAYKVGESALSTVNCHGDGNLIRSVQSVDNRAIL